MSLRVKSLFLAVNVSLIVWGGLYLGARSLISGDKDIDRETTASVK